MKKNLEINVSLSFDFRLVRLALVLLPFLCLAQELGSESIVLSTTYPSPVGIYARIITTGGAAGNPVNTILAQNAAQNGSRVGIGTNSPQALLDVAGGIKPGAATTGTSCGGNAEGSFGYDSSAHAPVYCNSSGTWVTMGGGIDYTNCVTVYHSDAISGIKGCADWEPATAPYPFTSTGICPNNFVPVAMTTGARYPGVCQKAALKCCKLN